MTGDIDYRYEQIGNSYTYRRQPYDQCPHCDKYDYTVMYDLEEEDVGRSWMGLFVDVEYVRANWRRLCENCGYREDYDETEHED